MFIIKEKTSIINYTCDVIVFLFSNEHSFKSALTLLFEWYNNTLLDYR